MVNSAVSVRGLRVVRSRTEILHGLEFDLAAGLATGLVGPSGCGKTTLIRAIAGAQAAAGELTVLGLPAGHRDLRRQVSYAAQSAAIYLDLSVEENIRYFAAVLRAPRGDVDRVIGEVDLGKWRGSLAGRLSGGQRSRVSLAIALLGQPRLLLLDEPTVGLDPVLREDLWRVFGRLRDSGITLLISSHVMEEAARCDRVLLMRDGSLLAHDTPAGLRERTGTGDLEQAFLRLISGAGPAGAGPAGAEPAGSLA
jgi:ABC-2 type transport system ATP-binding protein